MCIYIYFNIHTPSISFVFTVHMYTSMYKYIKINVMGLFQTWLTEPMNKHMCKQLQYYGGVTLSKANSILHHTSNSFTGLTFRHTVN